MHSLGKEKPAVPTKKHMQIKQFNLDLFSLISCPTWLHRTLLEKKLNEAGNRDTTQISS